MKKEDKNLIIDELTKEFGKYNHFYLADTSELDAEQTSQLRRKCFEKQVKLVVVKNTLVRKALEKYDGKYDELFSTLKFSTSVMFTEVANSPAKIIKDFRKGNPKPALKAAFVEESFYIGDDKLDALASLKSKNELIGDIIMILQSPAKNVISALQSGGNKLTGILQTLSEKK